jgi:endonuclease-3
MKEMLRLLEEHYSDATTELKYNNPFELLIATILAAQCTDRQVNKVTPGLFSKYPGPEEFAVLTPEELGKEIHTAAGFTKPRAETL